MYVLIKYQDKYGEEQDAVVLSDSVDVAIDYLHAENEVEEILETEMYLLKDDLPDHVLEWF